MSRLVAMDKRTSIGMLTCLIDQSAMNAIALRPRISGLDTRIKQAAVDGEL